MHLKLNLRWQVKRKVRSLKVLHLKQLKGNTFVLQMLHDQGVITSGRARCSKALPGLAHIEPSHVKYLETLGKSYQFTVIC